MAGQVPECQSYSIAGELGVLWHAVYVKVTIMSYLCVALRTDVDVFILLLRKYMKTSMLSDDKVQMLLVHRSLKNWNDIMQAIHITDGSNE